MSSQKASTTQVQLGEARQLIESKQYTDARKVLKKINDPTAKLWLKQLDAKFPPPKKHVARNLLVVVILAIVLGFGAIIVIDNTLNGGAREQARQELITNMEHIMCDDYITYSERWQNCIDDVHERYGD
ncbi:MAG: hypothetical protein ABI835_21960 [Chloroflexota bacterium]